MLLGAVVVASVVGAMFFGAAWWSLTTFQDATRISQAQHYELLGELLAGAAEQSLVDGDLTGLRRMVAETAQQHQLSTCRVVLADGTVVADAQPSRIARTPLPERFPTLPADAVAGGAAWDGPQICVRSLVTAAGRGRALLELSARPTSQAEATREVIAGFGLVGAAGLAGLWGAYRVVRRRSRAGHAILEALACESAGGAGADELRLGEEFGSPAVAWNTLIREREDLRRAQSLQKASDQVVDQSGEDGDLHSACDAIWVGLLILDEAAKVKYCNGAAAVLLRTKRDAMLGQTVEQLAPEPAAAETIRRVATGSQRARASVELERPSTTGGERSILRLTARPLRREDGGGCVLVVEDVTQQRVADESRNAFVAQATHELRTPLTNMRLYIETMTDQGDDPQVRTKCLNVIGSEARRLERIVGDMLSVSEIEAGAFKLHSSDIRLDALFEEIQADFRAQAEDKEIKLTYDLPPKLPVIQGDRDKLLLAINNLIGNALKYTPAGGAVTVKVEAPADVLRVLVTDNGIGIKPEEQELIFEKFYRSKDRRISSITGSGIGLALARQVVRLHGGEITCTSQIDKGSTFALVLPGGAESGGAVVERRAAA